MMFRFISFQKNIFPYHSKFLISKIRTIVSASMVKDLRERTGAGMMDCKKALMDGTVNGNIDKAIDWLRAKGIAKAAKNADRESSEGVIATFFNSSSSSNSNKVTVLEVNSETDFVGRNEDFQRFVLNVAKSTNKMNIGELNVDEILSSTTDDKKINDLLIDVINLIRENIKIKRAYNFDVNNISSYASYVHGKVYSNQNDDGDNIQMGKSACIIALSEGNNDNNNADNSKSSNISYSNETAYKLAMHATACKPNFRSIDDIPQDIIEKERAVCEAQTIEEEAKYRLERKNYKSKSDEVLQKIINGKTNKRLSEQCLLEQNHVAEEGNLKVNQILKQNNLKLSSFLIWTLGSI